MNKQINNRVILFLLILTVCYYLVYRHIQYESPSLNIKCLSISHRGASMLAPENTIAAFSKSIEFGILGIELDVRQSLDGEFVVIHDATVDRTTEGKGEVVNKTISELISLQIPTLKNVIQYLKDKIGVIMIELKEGNPYQLSQFLKEELSGAAVEYFVYTKRKDYIKQLEILLKDNFLTYPKCSKRSTSESYLECLKLQHNSSIIKIKYKEYNKEYVSAIKYLGKKVLIDVIEIAKESTKLKEQILEGQIDYIIGDDLNQLKNYQSPGY